MNTKVRTQIWEPVWVEGVVWKGGGNQRGMGWEKFVQGRKKKSAEGEESTLEGESI